MNKPELRFYSLWNTIGVALILLVIYLSVTPIPPRLEEFHFNDKIGHFIAYFVLMFWYGQIHYQFKIRLGFLIFFITLGYGLEGVQSLTAYRSFEYFDAWANASGASVAWLLTLGKLSGLLLRIEAYFIRRN